MPRHPAPLPRALRDSFTVRSAREQGVTPARLRAADLDAPFRGVRTTGVPTDVLTLARAYAPLLLPGQHFSHLTAARLLGLRMPKGADGGELHVTSLAPQRAPRVDGIVGHRASASRVVLLDGLPVSDPVSTWCDLGTVLGVRDLTVMGDGLVERHRPRGTIGSLSDAVADCAGRRGCRQLARALARVRPGTDSAMETVLRLLLIEEGLPEPAVNEPIRNRYGAVIAHADLAYPAHRIAIEYDGGHHRTDERQYDIDIDRLDDLMEEGWRVVRVNKNLLTRRATLLGKVRTALNQADAHGRPTPS